MKENKKTINQIKSFPEKPGIYIFKGKDGGILYVGKAKNLKKRAFSYFGKTAGRPFLTSLLKNIDSAEFITAQNENEALILESNLIKKYRPRYNIVLKDDKNYLFVKISGNDFPRVELVRKIIDKNAKYFGPFTSAKSIRKTMAILKKIFPFQKCNLEIKVGKPAFASTSASASVKTTADKKATADKPKRKKPCLYYFLGQCLGHCVSPTPAAKKEYRKIIDHIIKFFKGGSAQILESLQEGMKEASRKEMYEKAGQIRNQIRALEKITAPQVVYFAKPYNTDVISIKNEGKVAAINLFILREGKIIDKKNFLLQNPLQEKEKKLLSFFAAQYYNPLKKEMLPKEIWAEVPFLLPAKFIKVLIPVRGKKRKLIALGKENAKLFLKEKTGIADSTLKKSLKELQQVLKIKKKLGRIEAFDISNISGVFATGSMIVFKNGLPEKKEYRKFKVRAEEKPNDTKMMAEVLSRRFQKNGWKKPNLLVVDGGKPQLGTAIKVLQEKKLKIPVMALAKRKEEIFIPNKKDSIRLPKNSEGLKLLQRIRDEAHRFAVSYHRGLREKIPSALDEIPGIGPKYKKALLLKFGSINAIKKTGEKRLAKITNKKVAKLLKEQL